MYSTTPIRFSTFYSHSHHILSLIYDEIVRGSARYRLKLQCRVSRTKLAVTHHRDPLDVDNCARGAKTRRNGMTYRRTPRQLLSNAERMMIPAKQRVPRRTLCVEKKNREPTGSLKHPRTNLWVALHKMEESSGRCLLGT